MSEAEWVTTVMTPTPEDSPDVRWACETASAMWSRGQREQAVKWVHHAVQAATTDGKHERADELDRAAQELEHLPLLRRPSIPVASAPADLATETPASTTQPTAEDAPAAPKGKLARTAPYKLAPDDITYLEAPPLGLLEACEPSGTHATHAGVGPDGPASVPNRPLPPAPTQDPYETTVVNAGVKAKQERTLLMDMRGFSPGASEPEVSAPAPIPPAPAKAPSRSPGSLEPTPASLLGPPTAPLRPSTDFEQTVERRVPILRYPDQTSQPTLSDNAPASNSSAAGSGSVVSSAPGTLGSPNHPLESMRARRVAIAQGSGKTLSVQLLDDDEPAPVGTQEALLLPLKSN